MNDIKLIVTYLFVPTRGRIERWEFWAFFLLITEGAMFYSCLIPFGHRHQESQVLLFLLLWHLLSMFTGFLPLSIFMLLYTTWVAPQYDMWLLPFVLFCDLALYVYIVQCIKRCRDMGKAWCGHLFLFLILTGFFSKNKKFAKEFSTWV